MKLFRIILSSALLLLILVSSTSFKVGLHYCMGKVRNVSLFSHAEGCEKQQQQTSLPPCHRETQVPCCGDQTIVHEALDFHAASKQIHFSTPSPVTIESGDVLVAEVIPSSSVSRCEYYCYDPPLDPRDLTITNRVFII